MSTLREIQAPLKERYRDEPNGALIGHMARANPHWRSLEDDGPAIAIFNSADAYISPAWYEEKQLTGKVVPTWNYVMVQARGRLRAIDDATWRARLRHAPDRAL